MTLKVIGAGFGRTGTLSLKLALEQLGFGRCYHMMEVFGVPGAAQNWIDAAEGKDVDWDHVFDGFGATTDFPASLFYRQLADRYPDAKIVLTVRDADSWFASTQATIFNPGVADALKDAPPAMGEMIGKVVVGLGMGGNTSDRDRAIATYHAHNAAVARDISAERLLTYNVAEGWDSLCSFLGVAKPDTPFPRVNSREEFGQNAKVLAEAR